MEIVGVGDFFYTQGRLMEMLKLDREKQYDSYFYRYLNHKFFMFSVMISTLILQFFI
jgi:hypothetical protein